MKPKRTLTKDGMVIMLMIFASDGALVLMRRASGYGRVLQDCNGRSWLRNDCGPVYVHAQCVQRENNSSIMTHPGR